MSRTAVEYVRCDVCGGVVNSLLGYGTRAERRADLQDVLDGRDTVICSLCDPLAAWAGSLVPRPD